VERATSGGKGEAEEAGIYCDAAPRRDPALLAGTIVLESMGLGQIKRVVFFIHSEIPRNPRSDEENNRLSGRLSESTNCSLFLLFFPLKRYELWEERKNQCNDFIFSLRRNSRLMVGPCTFSSEELSQAIQVWRWSVVGRVASRYTSIYRQQLDCDCLAFATTLFYCVLTLSAAWDYLMETSLFLHHFPTL